MYYFRIIFYFTGSIPLRQLVYRVHPLPESMRPLVWDFGQLTHHTEELYTEQIVQRFMKSLKPSVSIHIGRYISLVVTHSGRNFMGILKAIKYTEIKKS